MKPIIPTEKRILELLAGGYSTNNIAATLAINRYTVLSHRRSLLGKFGANNSVQLIMMAIRDNVIELKRSEPESTI